MTSSNEKKKVPLIQFIKVDEASTSESATKDLHTIKTGEEEKLEQKKRDEFSSKQQLRSENASSNVS
uniref:Thymosin beta n=1 Tax=Panagrolaimus davidi TaxID=227884 RepID=A0A914PUI5_9BILA